MEMVLDNEILSTSQERITIYSFLKFALEKPLTTETLKLWKENFSSDFIEVLTYENCDLQAFFEDLKKNDLDSMKEQEKEAFLATFNIFNEEGKIPAPPWESVYVTRDRSMFGNPVFQMRKKLAEFDLQFIDVNKEPDDHIAIELEFMCYLINDTLEALKTDDEARFLKGLYTQYWLHKEHFMRWVQSFTKDIQSSDSSSFYNGVAELLRSFIAEDYEYIKSIKEGLENE